MPSHSHLIGEGTSTAGAYARAWGTFTTPSSSAADTTYEGGGASHSHGNTGNSATANTWRPKGINYTRQQKT